MQIVMLAHNAQTLADRLLSSLPSADIVPLSDSVDALSGQRVRDLDPEIVIAEPARLTKLWERFPSAWPHVKWVQSTFAGIEVLLPYARQRQFKLTRMNRGFAQPMAEYVFGHILAIRYRHREFHALQQIKHWDMRLAPTLNGQTLGLLGTGAVTTIMQTLAKQFGMSLIGVNRRGLKSGLIEHAVSTEQLYSIASQASIWVNTLPLTECTSGLIDRRFFSQLPENAIFVNVGRGQTVNEADLLEWLQSNPSAWAVCDVFCEEPLPKSSPLWQQKNLIITPHMAAKSQPDDVVSLFLENLTAYTEHRPLTGEVNLALGY